MDGKRRRADARGDEGMGEGSRGRREKGLVILAFEILGKNRLKLEKVNGDFR